MASKVVDIYHIVKQVAGKRRKARPSQANVPCQLLELEFSRQQFYS